jgi:hypothetical protein
MPFLPGNNKAEKRCYMQERNVAASKSLGALPSFCQKVVQRLEAMPMVGKVILWPIGVCHTAVDTRVLGFSVWLRT